MKAIKRLALVLFFGLIWRLAATAQIEPPNFICVKNDTLVWELPDVACGPFESYLIYASPNEEGPYSVLTTITDPDQDFFFHETAGNDLWYYYMESNFDCPGLNPFPSDTLDNLIPIGGPIDYVTIEGEDVLIEWTPSPSPEVFAYVISRNTATGTTVIDTVFSGNTYLDTTAAPNDGPETYFVVALDRCGNQSLVGDPHNTVFLQNTGVDPCEQAIDLAWNAYQNWPNGIGAHEVRVSVNGEPPVVVETTFGDAFSYRFDQANDGDEYCFTVRAIRGNDNTIVSNSNVICTTVDVTQPIRELTLANATYDASGAIVDLQWRWNDNAELSEGAIRRSTDGNNFDQLAALTVDPPLMADNTFTDSNVDPASGPYFYQITTVDDCDDSAQSEVVPTVYLTAAPQPDRTNLLTWTALANPGATEVTYEVFRNGQPLSQVGPTITQYNDAVDVDDPNQAAACYTIVADFLLTYPDGSTERLQSRSNIACAEQVAEMYVPNAFAPEGVNSVFRPILPFGAPNDYQLVIYDRWGGGVFESTDINRGWDGTRQGQDMPQGVYLYRISWQTSTGQDRERVGTVNLIR